MNNEITYDLISGDIVGKRKTGPVICSKMENGGPIKDIWSWTDCWDMIPAIIKEMTDDEAVLAMVDAVRP